MYPTLLKSYTIHQVVRRHNIVYKEDKINQPLPNLQDFTRMAVAHQLPYPDLLSRSLISSRP
jgi:hypothetical protein